MNRSVAPIFLGSIGIVLLSLAFAGCDKKPSSDEKTPAEPEVGKLAAALVPGVWSGEYGEIRFGEDGSVDLNIKNCGYETLSPGVIKMDATDACSVDSYKGKAEFEEYELGVIVSDDGTSYRFAAYMDGDVLHAGIGEVGVLGEDRQGTLAISPVRILTIGESCSLEMQAKGEEKKVHCGFSEVEGKTIFRYEEPDPFDETKTREEGMVYIEPLHLLVSPNVAQMTFRKQ